MNKIGGEPQERSSNIELLRILSMFLVLMIHYIPYRTLPTHDTLAHDTLGTLFDLELRSISFVCVNCFILISGYFGIRWKLKSFSNLLFQILFWAIVCPVIVSAATDSFNGGGGPKKDDDDKVKTKAKKKKYITGAHGSGSARQKAKYRQQRANRKSQKKK
jgi:hypothetical protein